MEIHLADGTYELFRHYYALPSARDARGREVAAVRGVLASLLGMVKAGATHVAVATDHVIESFRNTLWPGYKTSEGVEPDLLAQLPLLEEVLSAAGFSYLRQRSQGPVQGRNLVRAQNRRRPVSLQSPCPQLPAAFENAFRNWRPVPAPEENAVRSYRQIESDRISPTGHQN